jgi:hypothetical protein
MVERGREDSKRHELEAAITQQQAQKQCPGQVLAGGSGKKYLFRRARSFHRTNHLIAMCCLNAYHFHMVLIMEPF